ncbi:MAG: right-handed parallel beta-helix repeat-containing protein, partial [Pirellula sp.]
QALGINIGAAAASINFSELNLKPESRATIGYASDILVSDEVELEAKQVIDGQAKGIGFAVGIVGFGAMFADLELGRGEGLDEVEAGILGETGQAGTKIAASTLRIRANADNKLDVISVATSGGALAVAGATADLHSDQSTRAGIGRDAIINVNSLYVDSVRKENADSSLDAVSVGIIAGTGAAINNDLTGKARIYVSPGAVVNAHSITLDARNNVDKDRYGAFDGVNLATVSLSLAAGNVAQQSRTTIATDAVILVQTGATLRAIGTIDEPGSLRIATLTDVNAVDRTSILQVTGATGAVLADSFVRSDTRSQINVDGATLENQFGAIELGARGNAFATTSADVEILAGISAAMGTDSEAKNTNQQEILINNATFEGKDILLMAGRDLDRVSNVINSISVAEAFLASLFPSFPDPNSIAHVFETNKIDITGNTKFYAFGDIDLIARQGISPPDGRAFATGDLLSISLLPYFADADIDPVDSSVNQVTVANSAKLIAGVASSSVVQILPIAYSGTPTQIVPGLPISIGRALTGGTMGEKQALGIPETANYHFAPLDVAAITVDFYNGFIAKAITGAIAGGVANHYYRFKPNTAQGPQRLLLSNQNFADVGRWEDLGTTVPSGNIMPVYNSNISQVFAAEIAGKFAVVQPTEMDPVRLSYRNLGNLLFERRETILDWMEDHADDAEAIARYQVQLDEVEALLEQYGLTGSIPGPNSTTLTTFKQELDLLFIEVPGMLASPGSIFIEGTPPYPLNNPTYAAAFQPLVNNGVLEARAGAAINLLNESPFTMIVNGAVVKDNRRITTDEDGQYLALAPGNIYVNKVPLTNVDDNSDKVINIIQNATGPYSGFNLSTLPITPADIDQDLYIEGDIVNEDGSVLIDNQEGSIFVNAEIRAETVTINAAKDFNLNSEAWFHTNRDPRQYFNYDTFRGQLFDFAELLRNLDPWANLSGIDKRQVYPDTTVSDGSMTLAQAIAFDESRILAQGSITITARYLNVNGLIQSGAETIEFGVASNFVPPNGQQNFIDVKGVNLIPGLSFGVSGVPIDGYWDPLRGKNGAFVLDDIHPEGGRITIAGQLMSTGNGRLKVANGYPSINIDNDSPYEVFLSEIDITTFREGIITVIDSGLLTKAEYKFLPGPNQIQERRYTGQLVVGGDDTDGTGDGQVSTIQYTLNSTTNHAMGASLQYAVPAGLNYVWTEGQRLNRQTVTTYDRDDSWYADFLPFIDFDESTSTSEESFLDPRPMLESELRLIAGANGSISGVDIDGIPDYAIGSAYSIAYTRFGDPRTRLTQGISLVRNPPLFVDLRAFPPIVVVPTNSKVYEFRGTTNSLIDLTQTNYLDTALWLERSDIDAQTFSRDNITTFDSSFRNRKVSTTKPVEIDDDIYRTIKTVVEGQKDLYTHTLKADHPIGILFGNSPATPTITISSHGGMRFLDSVYAPANAIIDLFSTGGSIDSEDTSVIFGVSPRAIVAAEEVDLQIEGNKGRIDVLAGGDIDLIAISTDNLSSSFTMGNVTSTGGDVFIQAADGLSNDSSLSKIKGDRIELEVSRGRIGSGPSPLRIESNILGTGGLAALADENIHIVQTAGDMPLIRAISFASTASVESLTDDVHLTNLGGSILDGETENFKRRVATPTNFVRTKFINNGVASGLFSAQSVAQPLSPGLMKFLIPHANVPNVPVVQPERINVRGGDVVLTAANTGASVGLIGDNVLIVNPRNYGGLTTQQAEMLATAKSEDVVGVQYGLYRFLGSAQPNVNLTLENFDNTARWLKLNPHHTTGPIATVAVNRTVSNLQRVRVEFSRDLFGTYEYLGSTLLLNLTSENYQNSARWRKLEGAFSTDNVGNVSLANSMLITSKFNIDALTIRKTEDVNVQAATSLRATAHDNVNIESPNDMPVSRIVAGDDLIMRAGGTIEDNGIETAAIAVGGSAHLIAGLGVSSFATSQPFKTQITPSGSLRIESDGPALILQVDNDTIINGINQPIDQLFVSFVDAAGAVDIEVEQGDMLVGYIASATSIRLEAPGSILDAYPGLQGTFVNIYSSAFNASPTNIVGNVELIAGNSIGSASAPLTVDINSGKLYSLSNSHTWIHASSDLNAQSVVSTNGNVSLSGAADLRLGLVQAINGAATITAVDSILDLDHDASADVQAITIIFISSNGSVGQSLDDLEIDTADVNGLLSATAQNEVAIKEVSGRLNIRGVESNTADVRITVAETSAGTEHLGLDSSGFARALQGTLTLQAGDLLNLSGQLAAKNIFIRGDYRNQDTFGSIIVIDGSVSADYAEIVTSDDADTVLIGAAIMIGFVIKVAKGDDNVTGGSGNDQIYGDDGLDRLHGGQGNDWLNAGLGIGDELYGDEGHDTLIGSDQGADSDSNFNDTIRFGDLLDGGPGNDTIHGLHGADRILGGDGEDRIDAGGGTDLIHGGNDNYWIFVGGGTMDEAHGEAGDDELIGSNDGVDILTGGLGNDRIRGQAGNDTLHGNEGLDYLDGGAGSDVVRGGADNDEIFGGGGFTDLLYGESGDDTIHGSDDGSDMMYGGIGRDRMYGQGGNDYISGGAEDDMIDGGLGDDLIEGDAGRDILIGGAHHDRLYGLNLAGIGADNSLDQLYGDFGTNENEANSGQDQLFGHTSFDLMFGEAGDDAISVAGAVSATSVHGIVDYGIDDSPIPTNFVMPPNTPAPTVLPATPGYSAAQGKFPSVADDLGRWGELSGSASGLGLNRDGMSGVPSIAVNLTDTYVAWSDSHSGDLEIYVARHTNSGWNAIENSVGASISNSVGVSDNPNLIVTATGRPTVAWTERHAGGSDIRLAQFDPSANSGAGAWIALGTSMAVTGVTGTGNADHAKLIESSFGLVLVWQETVAGVVQIYARRFNGSAWVAIGIGSDSGTGISGAIPGVQIQEISLAQVSGKIAVVWTQLQTVGGLRQVYLREYAGTNWNEISGSASGVGVSGTPGLNVVFNGPGSHLLTNNITNNIHPSAAYMGSDLFVAWQAFVDEGSLVVTTRFVGGTGVATFVRSVITDPRPAQPQLVSGGSSLQIFWMDGQGHLYSERRNGSTMSEELPGDSTGIGITFTGREVDGFTTSIDSQGRPAVAWIDLSNDSPALMVRRNNFQVTGNVFSASDPASLAQILSGNDLGPGDVIVIQGEYVGNIQITAPDAGVLILGAPGANVTGSVYAGISLINQGADDVHIQRLDIGGYVAAVNSNRLSLRESSVGATLQIINGGVEHQVSHTYFETTFANASKGVEITGDASDVVVRNNVFKNHHQSISLGLNGSGFPGGASNVTITDNQISNTDFGLYLRRASSGLIQGNIVSANFNALAIFEEFDGWIQQNQFRDAMAGVVYNAPTLLSNNEITNNEVGISTNVNSTVNGLGYQSGVIPNQIHGNQIGASLFGTMQNQHIYQNITGVTGHVSLDSVDLAHGNLIERNTNGVQISNGSVKNQRIARNTIGILPQNNVLIANNLIYRNDEGIQISGENDVRVIGNTMYTAQGDLIRVTGGSQRTEIQNNILWTEDGYDIFVANDSTVGFHSDYNVLHTSGTGKIGYWTKDFNDILDWQEDINRLDLHSIGRTVVNPNWSQPQFVNLALDDYRIHDQWARQRRSSPTLDAGSPITDLALPASYPNLLTNPGFESGLSGWTAAPSGAIRLNTPSPFEGTQYFGSDSNATTTLSQTVDLLTLGFTTNQLDNDDLAVSYGGRVQSAAEASPDRGQLSITFLNASNVAIGSSLTTDAANLSSRWEQIGGRGYLPTGTRKIRMEFLGTRQSPSGTNDAFLDSAFVRVLPSTQAPDLGGYSASTVDIAQKAHLVLRSPDLYKDWERDKPLSIRWDSFGNQSDSPVRIDLYQDTVNGPQFVTNISTGTLDDGEFTWIAAGNGIAAGTYGLRIQIAFSNNLTVLDRSTETFTVPEVNDTFFVNDNSTVGDAFVSSIGSNRNTGKIASAPKPYPNNVLRIYELGANQTLTIDRGTYGLLYPLVIGNAQGVGNDEGFTLRGTLAGTTQLVHANSLTVAPILELNDADLMTIQDLSLTGGTKGLWLRNISTNLDLRRVRLSSNTQEGLLIDVGSGATLIDAIAATGNTGNGVRILGSLGTLSNSDISGNVSTGLFLSGVGGASVIGNVISNNLGASSHGVQILSNISDPVLMLGDSNLALTRGNRVFGNGGTGVLVSGNVQVAGNTIYGHLANNA